MAYSLPAMSTPSSPSPTACCSRAKLQTTALTTTTTTPRLTGSNCSKSSQASISLSARCAAAGCSASNCQTAAIRATGLLLPVLGITSLLVLMEVVSDFGTVINPMLLQGQLHGGILQGIGQAVYEDCRYDAETGQLITGSFMDYCLPRATHMPEFKWGRNETACLTNPLGIKGCGESGPTAALPAVMNAVIDALGDCDTGGLDMPVTAEKVWRVLNGLPEGNRQ